MSQLNKNWMRKLNIFKDYINEYNQLPSNYLEEEYKGEKIGTWLMTQIVSLNKGTLSEERIKLLNSVNPKWCASKKERRIESMRLLLASDWRSKVEKGETPIDTLFSEKELYKCLKENIYSCESFIKFLNDGFTIDSCKEYNRYEIYSKIFPSLDPQYLHLLCDILEIDINSKYSNIGKLFKEFTFVSKDDMISRMNNLMKENLTDREISILKYRYGINDTRIYSLKELGVIFDVTGYRISQLESRSKHRLKRIIKNSKNKIL